MSQGAADQTRPTMRDVAAAAGVSTALVSIVFRGVPGASTATRERVFAAAAELGYRTNRAASLLKLNRTKHLGVTMRVRSAFHAELVEAVQAAADRAKYELVLSMITATHDERRAIDTLLDFRCEAVVLIGSDLPTDDLGRLGEVLPVILIGRRAYGSGLDVVRTSESRGQWLMVEHLAALGHRDIVHVDGGQHPIADVRRRSFLTAMGRRGLASVARTVEGGPGEVDGRRAAARLLETNQLPTAINAFNDDSALGVIDALTSAGVRVPRDCSVSGYDNSLVSGFAAISLTTVSQEPASQADWAVAAAVERLDGGRRSPAERVLEPRLVVRGSTAPPRTV